MASSHSARNSNIEILRIVAMLMILILHVDFFALGEPTTEQAVDRPMQTFSKVFFEMFALISVNLFVLISGWFTIKFSIRGLFKLFYQCVFIITLMYAVGLMTGMAMFSKDGLLECLFMSDNAWFVKSYIGLYILAPVLNSFVAQVSKKQLLITLLAFYSFQTLYGCLYYSAEWIGYGCSVFSFIGLYLLARFVRVYCVNLFKYGLWIWLGSLAIATLWYWIPLCGGHLVFSYMAYHYSSPTTITGALGLLMWMASKPQKSNRIINWVATSCFTVYLYHICNSWTTSCYTDIAGKIFYEFSDLDYLIAISVFILLVFAGGILVDQIRKYSWKCVEIIFCKN